MAEIINTSMSAKKAPKKHRETPYSCWWPDIREMGPKQREGFKSRLPEQFREYGKLETSLTIEPFYTLRGIPEDTWYEWLSESAELKLANEFVKQCIGMNRTNAIYKVDVRESRDTLRVYSRVHKKIHDEDNAFKLKLKEAATEENKGNVFNINMPAAEKTDIPESKKREL